MPAKKRTASPAQLRALAKGRAKLKAARRRTAKPKRKTRAKNPAPIPRGLMRKRALGSNLKAGTAKTKARGRMANPSYFVIKSSTSSRYFDGAGWTVRKQHAAHYKMAKLAGLIGQKIADATGKSVSVMPA